jgi:hypothetical protein
MIRDGGVPLKIMRGDPRKMAQVMIEVAELENSPRVSGIWPSPDADDYVPDPA